MMTAFCKAIIEYMGCPCEVFENERDYYKVHNRYLELLEKGKSEGFTPLIISVDELMAEQLEENDGTIPGYNEVVARRKSDIEAAESIDALKILSESDYEPEIGKYDASFSPSGAEVRFSSIIDDDELVNEIIIAQIPTDKPWELAIYAPMGGFNECPIPEEQTAVFRYWYEKYGAIPAAVSRDVWELYVPDPVTDKETAMALAGEMYNFCCDIVDQGVGTIGALAGMITGLNIWYFWWD